VIHQFSNENDRKISGKKPVQIEVTQPLVCKSYFVIVWMSKVGF